MYNSCDYTLKFNYDKGNYEEFRNLANEINWDKLFEDKHCIEMWEIFKNKLTYLKEICIPKVRNRPENFKYKPGWWDAEISNLIRQKHRSYKKLRSNGYTDLELQNFRTIRELAKTIKK